jgi:hypothetical protein
MTIFTGITGKSSVSTMIDAIAKIHYHGDTEKVKIQASKYGNSRHKSTYIELHNVLCQQGIAIVFQAMKEREIHPDGTFDNKRRWYPSADEDIEITNNVRSPSVAYPFSYMKACRTKKHIQNLLQHSPELFCSHLKKVNDINYRSAAKKAEKASLLDSKNVQSGNTHYYDPISGQVLAID